MRSRGKKSDPRTTTQRFRDELRRRCIVRAAEQRHHLLAQLRGASTSDICQDIIRKELNAVGTRSWAEEDEVQLQEALGREAYIDLMAATEQSLQCEIERAVSELDGGGDAAMRIGASPLEQEQELALREYESFLAAQEAEMVAYAADIAESSPSFGAADSVDAVPCPLCVSAPLVVTSDGCVECSSRAAGRCGLRLETHGHPAPLQLLRDRMCRLLEEHGARCRGRACCRLPSATEATMGLLLLSCSTCGLCVGVV